MGSGSLLPGNVVVCLCFASSYFILLSVSIRSNCNYVIFIFEKKQKFRWHHELDIRWLVINA